MTPDLAGWIGRTRVQAETLAPELARRYAAAIGAPLDVEAAFPPLGHWAYFNDAAAAADLGPDGHPRRGLFMPPIALPRRMFASAEIVFAAPLALGQPAEMATTIADLRERSGRSGALVLVDVTRRLTQGGEEKLVETQTIVYREAGPPTPPVEGEDAGGAGEAWRPTSVDLFRFSAATYNGHRIHYDLPYAQGEEGYPGLVVHGPLTAARLCGLALRTAGAPLRRFSFRALAPLFAGQTVRFRTVGAGALEALRCDGQIAMSAAFEA